MKKLSAIVIAKDEERNIKRCIDSLLKCVDDLVVIIDKSTSDSTIEIVKTYKNIFSEVIQWSGYSQTKTYAVSKTKYDWVLWLDADEELTDELIEEINKFKTSAETGFIGFKIARRAYFLGKWIKHSGWYPARVIRLFNKNHIRFNDNLVHEGLVINGKVSLFNSDINHYTDPDIQHYYQKFNHYTSLAAKDLAVKNKKAGLWDIIARPPVIFFKMYILKLGFLDGLHGLILAVFSANYVFTKYSKLWELKQSNEGK